MNGRIESTKKPFLSTYLFDILFLSLIFRYHYPHICTQFSANSTTVYAENNFFDGLVRAVATRLSIVKYEASVRYFVDRLKKKRIAISDNPLFLLQICLS